MTDSDRKKVVIHQIRLPHYREALFERLRELCLQTNIELRLIYGQSTKQEASKRDEGSLPWANKVRNRYLRVAGRDLVYQPSCEGARNADLIVLQQENRILSNYSHLLFRRWQGTKIAYWGHGANFQSLRKNSVSERWKRWLGQRVDWWFAYTQISVDVVKEMGYPEERITCLNNSFDTRSFQDQIRDVTEDEKNVFRQRIGARKNDRIALYCGSLYKDKRIDLLLRSSERVHKEIRDFHLVILGDGPERERVRQWHDRHDWIHWEGVVTGREKALWFSLAEVLLNPGTVGLHVLDSFVSGVPMISTHDARHGPEICYLRSGVNGLLVDSSVDAYAASIIDLLSDPWRLETIGRKAWEAGEHYTVEAMAERFFGGIVRCLETPSYRSACASRKAMTD